MRNAALARRSARRLFGDAIATELELRVQRVRRRVDGAAEAAVRRFRRDSGHWISPDDVVRAGRSRGQLIVLDDQRRCERDDVAVDARLQQDQPAGNARCTRSIKNAASTNSTPRACRGRGPRARAERRQSRARRSPSAAPRVRLRSARSPTRSTSVDHGERGRTAQRVAEVGRRVQRLAARRRPCVDDVRPADRSRERRPARDRLSDAQDVRDDVLVFAGEHRPRSGEAGVDLIEDQDDFERIAQRAHAAQIARRRDDDPRPALDRFDDERADRTIAFEKRCAAVRGAVERASRMRVVEKDRRGRRPAARRVRESARFR